MSCGELVCELNWSGVNGTLVLKVFGDLASTHQFWWTGGRLYVDFMRSVRTVFVDIVQVEKENFVRCSYGTGVCIFDKLSGLYLMKINSSTSFMAYSMS